MILIMESFTMISPACQFEGNEKHVHCEYRRC